MVNRKHTAETVYHYNRAGSLERQDIIGAFSNEPFMITDFFFDSSGKRYASVMHGAENRSSYVSTGNTSTWRWTSVFADSLVYYYEYRPDNKLNRAYRLFPSGKLMFDILYSYEPKIVTRRSYNEIQKLAAETIDCYERDLYITSSLLKRYDSSGNVVSTFTQEFMNTYNTAGQLVQVNYRNDTCSCRNEFKYYSSGLIKSVSNVICMWNKRFTYKYYKAKRRRGSRADKGVDKIAEAEKSKK